MSRYYEEIYRRRLNRYGYDYQSRIQNQRERDFDTYLYKTIYRVDFQYDGDLQPASLERYGQDYTETKGYLLTRTDLKIPNGTILMVQSRDDTITPWMVWWLEHIEASGYNRYVVLKMTHYLTWKKGTEEISQWGYFSGPGNSTITDTIKSSTGTPIYTENNNLHMFVTTQNETIDRDMYFEVTQGNITQGYVVKEFDINSTPGVNYVTVDPVPLRPAEEVKNDTSSDADEEYFWLQGGKR